MTVKELIKELKKHPADSNVVIFNIEELYYRPIGQITKESDSTIVIETRRN